MFHFDFHLTWLPKGTDAFDGYFFIKFLHVFYMMSPEKITDTYTGEELVRNVTSEKITPGGDLMFTLTSTVH